MCGCTSLSVNIATSAAAPGTVLFPKGNDGDVHGREDGDVAGVIPGGSVVTFPVIPGRLNGDVPDVIR
jgi:hypothetical protein